MSEYQYYEFVAVDKPLDARQMAELRELSTRADISSRRFVNEYHWGDFKGNPRKIIEKYFDGFVYYANWGTHWHMLRLPRRGLDLKVVKPYCGGNVFSAWAKGQHIVVSFLSEDEDGDWEGEDEHWLTDLIPLRDHLLQGDLRPLYLGWLAAAQAGELNDDADEPTVPPGLQKLTPALSALADFLRIDGELLAAATKASRRGTPAKPTQPELKAWITRLPAADKNAALLRLLDGEESHVGTELKRRFQHDWKAGQPGEARAPTPRRTVGELREAAKQRQSRRSRSDA
ncbi:MAG: hypothetical protein WD278_19615 [Pirellulales bacterium]